MTDASHPAMHRAPTPKTLTAYGLFDVTEVLQTRMQNARDERAATRDAKSPYPIGFLMLARSTICGRGVRRFSSFLYAHNAA